MRPLWVIGAAIAVVSALGAYRSCGSRSDHRVHVQGYWARDASGAFVFGERFRPSFWLDGVPMPERCEVEWKGATRRVELLSRAGGTLGRMSAGLRPGTGPLHLECGGGLSAVFRVRVLKARRSFEWAVAARRASMVEDRAAVADALGACMDADDLWERIACRIAEGDAEFRLGDRGRAVAPWLEAGRLATEAGWVGVESERASTSAVVSGWLGQFDEARELLERARRTKHGGALALAELHENTGSVALMAGDHTVAVLELRASLALRQQRGADDRWARTASVLATELADHGRFARARQLLEKASEAPELEDARRGAVFANRALVELAAMRARARDEDYSVPEAHYRVALAALRAAEADEAQIANVAVHQVGVLVAQRRWAKARAELEAYRDMPAARLANGHWIRDLLWAQVFARDPSAPREARRAALEALTSTQAAGRAGRPSWTVAEAWTLLGDFERREGRLEDAEAHYRRAIEAVERSSARFRGPPAAAWLLHRPAHRVVELAHLLARTGRAAEAFDVVERYLARSLRERLRLLELDQASPRWRAFTAARHHYEELRKEPCGLLPAKLAPGCRARLRDSERALDLALERVRADTMLSRSISAGALTDVQAALGEEEALLMAVHGEQDWLTLFVTRGRVEVARSSEPLEPWLSRIAELGRVFVVGAGDPAVFDLGLRTSPDGRPWIARTLWSYVPHAGFLVARDGCVVGSELVVLDPDGTTPSVRSLSEILPGAERLIGAAATRAKVRSSLAASRWWHFSGHAHVGDHLLDFRLELADGTYTALDIVSDRLRVGGAFLHGCTTGPSSEGGVSGLPAVLLLAAGADVVVASRRDLDERASTRLVRDYYRAGGDRSEAFRAMVRGAYEREDPAWSAFRLYGRPTSASSCP